MEGPREEATNEPEQEKKKLDKVLDMNPEDRLAEARAMALRNSRKLQRLLETVQKLQEVDLTHAVFVREGDLVKIGAKKVQERRFYLFSNYLIWTKPKLIKRGFPYILCNVIAISDLFVADAADTNKFSDLIKITNINNGKEYFLMCDTKNTKRKWLRDLRAVKARRHPGVALIQSIYRSTVRPEDLHIPGIVKDAEGKPTRSSIDLSVRVSAKIACQDVDLALSSIPATASSHPSSQAGGQSGAGDGGGGGGGGGGEDNGSVGQGGDVEGNRPRKQTYRDGGLDALRARLGNLEQGDLEDEERDSSGAGGGRGSISGGVSASASRSNSAVLESSPAIAAPPPLSPTPHDSPLSVASYYQATSAFTMDSDDEEYEDDDGLDVIGGLDDDGDGLGVPVSSTGAGAVGGGNGGEGDGDGAGADEASAENHRQIHRQCTHVKAALQSMRTLIDSAVVSKLEMRDELRETLGVSQDLVALVDDESQILLKRLAALLVKSCKDGLAADPGDANGWFNAHRVVDTFLSKIESIDPLHA